MSIVLDNLGPELEAQLRAKVEELHESPANVAAQLIRKALQTRLEGEALRQHMLSLPQRRDLSDIAGTWEEDPEFDAAMAWLKKLDDASMG